MTGVALGISWLLPPAVLAGRPCTLQAPAGQLWDAVRTTQAAGMPVLARLLGDEDDQAFLGPVVGDPVHECMYWLVAPGHTDDYPPGCTLLGEGAWLTVPESADARSPIAQWLHLPDRRVLSGPAWLSAALSTGSER